ncbi:MAG: 3-deoxy-7-phosphoheptulonate synthase, partial [Oligoflexus sp.]|nr:3-deoxy-7-phosphoheptulonate synthase [Oligoflexus sp.]
DIEDCIQRLMAPTGHRLILVDCSHGNSSKDFQRQPIVFRDVVDQVNAGQKAILGVMLESNLQNGKQDPNASPLVVGRSITDGCISWEETESLLRDAHKALR